jgi:hypothetical protein
VVADSRAPPVGAPFSFLQRPLSLFNSASQGYRRVLHLLRFPPSNYGLQSRAVILMHVSPSNFPFLPFPFLLYAVAPPGVNGKLAGRRTLPLPLSLCPYLRLSPSSCLPFALTSRLHALEHHIHPASLPLSPLPLEELAVGEGSLSSFFPLG